MSPVEEFYVVSAQPTPHWYLYPVVAPFAEKLEVAAAFNKGQKEALFNSWEDPLNIEALIKTAKAIKESSGAKDFSESGVEGAKFAMHGIYDALRENAMLFDCWDNALAKFTSADASKDLSVDGLKHPKVADKVGWLHSALIGHLSHHFTLEQVQSFVKSVSASYMTSLGKMEAMANLLKSTTFRADVWSMKEAQQIVEDPQAVIDPKLMYKCVFAYWMLSFEDATMKKLAGAKAVEKIRDCLSAESKAEKVVRLSLEVLRNFLKCKDLEEDIVTSEVMPAVKALEYEKWREAELYDRIRELTQAIDVTVSKVSNFGRYKKELDSKTLVWSPLHSSTFWADSGTQKELNLGVVEALVSLVKNSNDTRTVAVACNDIGEIAVLHKDGKTWVRQAQAKDEVMKKMSEKNDKEVRREALLCCQKIMLNKWQEAQK